MRPWGPALALAAGCAAGNACLVDLDHVLACGDGYVDPVVGEQCDPNDPQKAYLGACPEQNGGCDPETCEILNDALQCAKCGDGVIDFIAGEECDGSNIGAQCWGDGSPTCSNACKLDFSSCDSCGNGVVDPGEECDDVGMDGGIVIPRPCAGSEDVDPLRSPYIDYPYTSGSAVSCLPNCKYDRASCGYCGNGKQEGPLQVSIEAESLPEACDGDDFDTALLAEQYPMCEEIGAQANVACEPNCLDFEPRRGQPACCLPKNESCPADGDELRCCYEYAHPETADFCLPVLLPNDSGGGDGEGGNAVVCR